MTCIDRWLDSEAQEQVRKYCDAGYSEDIALRTYSARLLGNDPELVLHGGGNTSVKTNFVDIYGEKIPTLCVKGSGWDLGNIEPPGHPAVKLEPLQSLKELDSLSDEDMVSIQRQNLINPNSPNPSVETLLHAFLPYKFIDHTHSIAILALADQPNSEEICKKIYGDTMVIVPYVMPGFELALKAFECFSQSSRQAKKKGVRIEGMILLKHGVFSFGDSAKDSYKKMISIVNKAENFLPRKIDLKFSNITKQKKLNHKYFSILPYLRGLICRESSNFHDKKCIFDIRSNKDILEFINSSNIEELSRRGVATPDHVIRTKSKPLVLDSFLDDIANTNYLNKWLNSTRDKLLNYISEYDNYFKENNDRCGGIKTKLDPMPRLILLPEVGLIALGDTKNSAKVNADIGEAWIETLLSAESLGTFNPISEQDTFELEYWSLEQAKLGKQKRKTFAGNVVLITGAGGVLGSQIAREFYKNGAEVVILDKDPDAAKNTAELCGENSLWIECDITNDIQIQNVFDLIVRNFGGLDILVSNAGAAWEGNMHDLDEDLFRKSMELNLFAHQKMAKNSVRIFKSQDYLEKNKDLLLGGQLLFNISKQAINPGIGFGAYGIAKAALLALMKQYAAEEGKSRIRANGINADRIRSGLLNNEMIKSRSFARGLSENEYMSGNLLGSEVRPEDVSQAFISLALMERTTGALLTIDGGNIAAMVR